VIKRESRRRDILNMLRPGESHALIDIARALNVSEETVRRELKLLEQSGSVVRTHGAVCLATPAPEGPFERRMQENVDAKKRIAAAAVRFVGDGDTLFIDAGSTACFVAQALVGRQKLTVITNALAVAQTLGGRNGNSLFLAGGELDYDYKAFSDHTAQAYVAQFTPHLAILTVGAIHADHGLMDRNAREAAMTQIAYARADRVLLVAEHGKFGRLGLIRTAEPDDVDILVTDQPLEPPYADLFRRTTVVVAP
jgi:DeoR family glycerol-3-phosphate regulon repressor